MDFGHIQKLITLSLIKMCQTGHFFHARLLKIVDNYLISINISYMLNNIAVSAKR